jgi:hypothetical protein
MVEPSCPYWAVRTLNTRSATRTKSAQIVDAGYFVLAAVFTIRASAAGPSDVDLIAMLALILALCGGTAHAAVLSFGRRR